MNKQYDLCLSVLEMQLDNSYCNKKMESCKAFIKAQCFEAQDNKLMAIESYAECLKKDATNVEAFNRLTDCQLISGTQKQELLNIISFAPEDAWLKKIYILKIKET